MNGEIIRLKKATFVFSTRVELIRQSKLFNIRVVLLDFDHGQT